MKKLMMQIKEDKQKRKITNKFLAQKLGVSATSVSNYFKTEGDQQQRIAFESFLVMVEIIYEDSTSLKEERILQFCLKNDRKDNDKVILEWLANHGKNDIQRMVIERIKGDTYHPLLGSTYELLLKRKMNEIAEDDFYFSLEGLKNHKISVPEEKVLLSITNIYANWDLRAFIIIDLLANKAMKDLEEVSCSYLKKSYQIRINEMKIYAYLRLNRIDDLIQLAENVITVENEREFPMCINSIYCTLAEAYAFRDFKKSMFYIKRAMNISPHYLTNHEKRKRGLEATHDFIKIVNEDYSDLIMSDLSEEAHLHARIGNKEKALNIISEIEKTKELTPHQNFYKALVYREKEMLMDACAKFTQAGDLFYTNLVRKYL